MRASTLLTDHIKQSEGYRSEAYRCPAGRWTCGYGHTRGVTRRTTCDVHTAEQWLREDLQPCEDFVKAIRQIDTQGKYDACVDFCYNVGVARFRDSTLLRLIRAGAPARQVQDAFRQWVYGNGRKLPGLVARREWEARRWTE